MSNFFKRHTPLFDNPSSFQKLNPGECCIDDVFLSDAVIALNGSVWELTLTLNDGTVHVAPLPPAFADVYVVSFARHPDALTDPAFVNTIRITLSDGTIFDLDLSFLVGGGEDLAATLVLGNITGGTDIITSNDDVVRAASGGGELNLRVGGDNIVELTTDNGVYNESWVYATPTAMQIGFANPGYFNEVTAGGSFINGIFNQSFVFLSKQRIGTLDQSPASLLATLASLQIANNSVVNVVAAAEEFSAVLINSGAVSSLTTFNSGVNNSVAIGGVGLTANTDNTAYANQVSLQQAGNAFNTFVTHPSLGATADNTAEFQDASGTIAYLSDIPGGSANMYNVDGTLTANRTLDGNLKVNSLFFIQLGSFQVALTDNILLSSDGAAELTGTTLALGGSTSVGISTPNIVATLGKIGQVLTLSNTAGICDWEDKYFAIDLHSVNHPTIVSVVNVGSNWTYTVIHNLDSLDVKPEIFRLSDGKSVGAAIRRINVNEVTVRVKSTLSPNGVYRIII